MFEGTLSDVSVQLIPKGDHSTYLKGRSFNLSQGRSFNLSQREIIQLISKGDHLKTCRNVSSGIRVQREPRSDCADAQSDQGLRCPQIESFDTVDCINGEQLPG